MCVGTSMMNIKDLMDRVYGITQQGDICEMIVHDQFYYIAGD